LCLRKQDRHKALKAKGAKLELIKEKDFLDVTGFVWPKW